MPNINKNIIMQAGAAVANATNKAAGLSASTPEPGAIISAIQLVNGGRKMGPTDIAHFTESVRNKLLSLLVNMEPIQSGAGTPSPDNVRPISGRTGLSIYVSPTPNAADATTYAVDWTTPAGTVYGGTLDVVTGVLTVDTTCKVFTGAEAAMFSTYATGEAKLPRYTPGDCVFTTDTPCISNMLRKATGYVDLVNNAGTVRIVDASIVIHLDGYQGSSYDGDAFMAELARLYALGNPLEIAYTLATPLTYQLTGQDIITLWGDNYIWSDSGDVTITE